MAITAKELAQKLGLSAAAVSMALNHKPGVSTQTRKKVIEAAEKYGYDFTKISSKQMNRGAIYLVIYKKHGAIVDDTPFFAEVSDGITETCRSYGYKLKITYLYQDEINFEKQLKSLYYSDCAGIILLGTEMNPEDIKPFQRFQVPYVLLDAYFEVAFCDCVLINNVQGAFLATNHLIKTRKQQPGYLRSAYSIGNFSGRNSGFFKAIRAHGMSSNQSIVHELTPSVDGAYADMIAILENHEPLASCYFADNDHIAIGTIKALKKYGYRIPEDIAIIGFDNIPFGSVIDPALTTINVPKKYMGQMAVERLYSRIHHPGIPPVKIEINTTLIERHSS